MVAPFQASVYFIYRHSDNRSPLLSSALASHSWQHSSDPSFEVYLPYMVQQCWQIIWMFYTLFANWCCDAKLIVVSDFLWHIIRCGALTLQQAFNTPCDSWPAKDARRLICSDDIDMKLPSLVQQLNQQSADHCMRTLTHLPTVSN